MVIDLIQVCIFGLYLLLIPGLPLALLLARSTGNWRLPLAVAPIFSIGANYFGLTVVNYLGIRPNLVVFAALLITGTGIWCWRIGLPTWLESSAFLRGIAPIAPATFIGLVIFRKAYAGYLLVAPNQDALNHNVWIARIAGTGSALMRDSEIASPLQRLGSGGAFYPFAWHTSVAVASKLSGITVATASLVSTILIWTVVLPAGLNALAWLWSPAVRHLGPLAGFLVQLYPLVPGVPLSWGSMTSVVGVALLPAAVMTTAYMLRDGTKLWTFAGVAVGATLFFVHTPEAATLAVLFTVQFITVSNERIRRNFVRLLLGLAVFLMPAAWIFRGYIFGDHANIRALFGAAQPEWDRAIGAFFATSINVPTGYTILGLLFIAGLIAAARDKLDRWMLDGIAAMLVVYLVSGAGTGFLSHLRIFTAPWYASYERTLWVVVPFAALASAYAIARLLPTNMSGGTLVRAAGAALAAVLLVVVVYEQVRPSIRQLRSGPARSAMVGPHDLDVIATSRRLVKPGEIAIGFYADGTVYPFVYKGVRVSTGAALGNDGRPSTGVASIMANIHDLCADVTAQATITNEHIVAFVLAKRGVWGVPLWTDAEVRQLPGLKLVESGDFLVLLTPDLARCK